ncbi:LysR family transcriptional regulator [Chamaesiphon sp. GL140_3_metabinner_50]|uniref:LysR family transcriptional regulator n=1 Tax=Chamaesiphon sp. GL140_3_metabinner_50 TaxID=2970812 RepID=UPI0025F7B991|nr:LysR family transcriptional regulator [Chamaesiphon sp. GL140_3_metabinner_50]
MDALKAIGAIELYHLRYFIVVAEELNINRAAEKLQMAQPPLSQQIQMLEKRLDVKLFDRKNNRILQLTQAGATFLVEARSMLANLERAAIKTQQIDRGKIGHLTIGFTSAMMNGVLPNILLNFRHKYPEIELILKEENSFFHLQKLRDRTIDTIFTYRESGLEKERDLAELILCQESLMAILPERHPLASKLTLTISDLKNEEFIMPDRAIVPGLSAQIYKLCLQAEFTPKVAQSAIFMVTILGLVAGGIGISILPSSVRNLHRTGVVYRPIRGEIATSQLTIVWRCHESSKILEQFLEIAQATAMN